MCHRRRPDNIVDTASSCMLSVVGAYLDPSLVNSTQARFDLRVDAGVLARKRKNQRKREKIWWAGSGTLLTWVKMAPAARAASDIPSIFAKQMACSSKTSHIPIPLMIVGETRSRKIRNSRLKNVAGNRAYKTNLISIKTTVSPDQGRQGR